jgi:hypothetical protein
MIENANAFPASVLDNGVPLKVQLSPYTDFVQYSGKDSSLSRELRYALQDLNEIYVDYMFFRNDLKHMINHTQNYSWDNTSVNNLKKYLDETKYKMRDIQELAEKLIKGKENPKRPVFTSLDSFKSNFRLPLQKFRIGIPTQTLHPFTKHSRGDQEMKGHSPKMTISAKAFMADNGKKLKMTISGIVAENQKDWTTFKGSKTVDIFNRDYSTPGYVIKGFSPKNGTLSHQFGEDDHKWRTVQWKRSC